MLPFTHETFIDVFRVYNTAIWPAQVVAYLLGATILLLVLRPTLAESDVSRSVERLKESGADCVVTTTQEALEAVSGLLGGSQREVTGGGRDGGDGGDGGDVGDVGDVGDEGKKRVATI